MTVEHTPPTTDAVAAGPEERVRASFARQGLMRLLGAELAAVEAGTVTIRLRNRPELS